MGLLGSIMKLICCQLWRYLAESFPWIRIYGTFQHFQQRIECWPAWQQWWKLNLRLENVCSSSTPLRLSEVCCQSFLPPNSDKLSSPLLGRAWILYWNSLGWILMEDTQTGGYWTCTTPWFNPHMSQYGTVNSATSSRKLCVLATPVQLGGGVLSFLTRIWQWF